jgi:hypothetical protein
MLREPTIEKLHAMRLRVMASTWIEQDRSPDTIALPFDERLALLVDAEMLARDNGRLIKNLRDAKLRIADACMEGIDCPRARDLDKALVRTLTTCRWIAEHQTVIVTGATGTRQELHRMRARPPGVSQGSARHVPSRAASLRRAATRSRRRLLSAHARPHREDRRPRPR